MLPEGIMFQFAYQLDKTLVLSNNQAEYEALIISLEIALDIKIKNLVVIFHSW